MKNKELLYTLILTLIPNLGPVTGKKLIALCGSAENVFNSTGREKLKQLKGSRVNLILDIDLDSLLLKAKLILETLEKNKIDTFFYRDKNYPFRLNFIPDAPLILFSKGNVNLNRPRTLVIVGTRTPSRHGYETCMKLLEELRSYNPTIISGLAYGIDICAQKQALKHGLHTLSIMAHGHKFLYPPDHQSIADQLQLNGGLISEFEFHQKPEREFFPMRNRLIAALSDACLVIESKAKGGSMITANLAFDYNKDVLAVPGRTHDAKSKGCNLLIKTNKASLVESAEDIANALNWTKQSSLNLKTTIIPKLTGEEEKLFKLIYAHRESDIEQIFAQSSLSLDKINSTLLSLEFKGLIKSLPGKRIVLINS